MADLTNPKSADDDNRCESTHWSLPVQCVLPSSHRENWHEGWHPETGNRMRYRYPGSLTEELHHGKWHSLFLPQSAERAHAYKMGGAGRESFVDALAKQLHHNESLHLHTLPGDEGEACKYCYLRAGRAVGALVPATDPVTITTADQLRALPSGAVLLDGHVGHGSAPVAWQIHGLGSLTHAKSVISARHYQLGNAADMADLLDLGPFRVLHTPGDDRG